MEEEKLTLERVASNIEIELTKSIDFETSPYAIAEIKTLLKQIREEILQEINVQPETPMLAVLEVFIKYISEREI